MANSLEHDSIKTPGKKPSVFDQNLHTFVAGHNFAPDDAAARATEMLIPDTLTGKVNPVEQFVEAAENDAPVLDAEGVMAAPLGFDYALSEQNKTMNLLNIKQASQNFKDIAMSAGGDVEQYKMSMAKASTDMGKQLIEDTGEVFKQDAIKKQVNDIFTEIAGADIKDIVRLQADTSLEAYKDSNNQVADSLIKNSEVNAYQILDPNPEVALDAQERFVLNIENYQKTVTATVNGQPLHSLNYVNRAMDDFKINYKIKAVEGYAEKRNIFDLDIGDALQDLPPGKQFQLREEVMNITQRKIDADDAKERFEDEKFTQLVTQSKDDLRSRLMAGQELPNLSPLVTAGVLDPEEVNRLQSIAYEPFPLTDPIMPTADLIRNMVAGIASDEPNQVDEQLYQNPKGLTQETGLIIQTLNANQDPTVKQAMLTIFDTVAEPDLYAADEMSESSSKRLVDVTKTFTRMLAENDSKVDGTKRTAAEVMERSLELHPKPASKLVINTKNTQQENMQIAVNEYRAGTLSYADLMETAELVRVSKNKQ